MASWNGWQVDLLAAARLDNVSVYRNFLTSWQQHDPSNCRNNPVLISRTVSGSTSCKALTDTRTAQNYGSPQSGAQAFAAQLRSGNFDFLLQGFTAGTLWQPGHSAGIYGDLIQWGAAGFAAWYKAQFGDTFGGPGGGSVRAPHAIGGYNAIRRHADAAPRKVKIAQANFRRALKTAKR